MHDGIDTKKRRVDKLMITYRTRRNKHKTLDTPGKDMNQEM